MPGSRANPKRRLGTAAHRGRVGPSAGDRTRERSAILNQLLLTAVVFVVGALVELFPFDGDPTLMFAGVVLVMALTGATLVVPWNRMAVGWVALVPVGDVLAIALMQLAAPTSAIGLLWIFPTTWLASGFGLLGLAGVIVAVAGITIMIAALDERRFGYAVVLLPLVLLALAVTSYLTARRADAQRLLLAKQATLLAAVLERTRRQEQMATEVLDAVDFGIIRIGADDSVSIANDAHARLQRALAPRAGADAPAFGADGRTPLDPADLPFERARRGEAFDGVVVWFGAEGEERTALSVSARRLVDSTGTDTGAVVVSRDVTSELTALRARDDLVASVSHELRTPLTSILGFLELALGEPDLTPGVRDSLRVAERNAERLLRLVGDILAASSASTASQVSLTPQLLDAAVIVRASAEGLSPRAAERAIAVDTEAVARAPVWGDALRLRQVVDNLLANAITYNRDGGSVTLGTTTEGGSTWIVVRDSGTGIAEEDRSRIFRRYYRAGGGREPGTGLGLAITRDIVRAHGGEIAVRSSVGVGSTFFVRLPSRGPADPEEADA